VVCTSFGCLSVLRRYQSPIIRASPHEAGIRSCIPPKSNRKAKIRWTMRTYRERYRIEQSRGNESCAEAGLPCNDRQHKQPGIDSRDEQT